MDVYVHVHASSTGKVRRYTWIAYTCGYIRLDQITGADEERRESVVILQQLYHFGNLKKQTYFLATATSRIQLRNRQHQQQMAEAVVAVTKLVLAPPLLSPSSIVRATTFAHLSVDAHNHLDTHVKQM